MIIRTASILVLFILAGTVNAQVPQTEEEFKSYFIAHADSLDNIEGIWNVKTTQEYYRYDTLYDVDKIPESTRIAIIRKGDAFESYDLNGAAHDVQFTPTSVEGVYFYRNFFRETNEYSKANAVISRSGEMEYNYDFPDNYLKIKLGETYEEGTRVVNKTTWFKVFPEKKK